MLYINSVLPPPSYSFIFLLSHFSLPPSLPPHPSSHPLKLSPSLSAILQGESAALSTAQNCSTRSRRSSLSPTRLPFSRPHARTLRDQPGQQGQGQGWCSRLHLGLLIAPRPHSLRSRAMPASVSLSTAQVLALLWVVTSPVAPPCTFLHHLALAPPVPTATR